MAARPIIGIPTQTLQAIEVIPEGLPLSWVMNHRYYVAVASTGGAPFMVPLLEDEAVLRTLYEQLDGLFLAGGVDLDPSTYGEDPHELCGRTDRDRDRVELLFTRWALEDGKPIFGVCRGMQIINVATGGSLLQDCTAQHPDAIKHDYFPGAGYARDYLAHEVRLAPGSRLHGAFGDLAAPVNSMHHQGIARMGAGLVASAFAPDGLVEAVESESGFVVGVQWHPEALLDTDPGTRRLFEAFVDAARDHAQGRSGARLVA